MAIVLRLAALAALAALLPAQAAPAGKVDYAAHGHRYLQELGEAQPPALAPMLAAHYSRLLLGDFDLCVPNSMLAKGSEPARVAAIAGALLDLQDRLDKLTTADANTLKVHRAETATLRKYVGAWKAKPTLEAPQLPKRVDPCLLLLAPDRKTFVGVVGWLGLWKQTYRDYWWNDATAQFSDLRVQDEGQVQVVALEYAAPKQNGDVTLGFAMDTRERTGLLQHVLQRAAVSWGWRMFGDEVDQAFLLGFATALVVDVLGQNNARSGGSGKSSVTEGNNAFIPGAPSAGGGMEMVNADSAWRLSLGQDWFARVLRQAQKAGEHEAKGKDRIGNFLLRDEKATARHPVTAPFLGKVAFEREAVPAAFLDDYLEFHRAYRAAFVHWLQGFGTKGKAASAERFRELLAGLMEKKAGASFEHLCEQLYALPLSAKAPETDTLERRFLAWIAENSR